MMTQLILGLTAVLTLTSFAGEPNVEEKTLGNGLTELRVMSAAKQVIATYQVDLKHHHEPATSDSGIIQQWEHYRFGGFFCFNDNQFVGTECPKNRDAGLYNPTKLDVAGWAATMKKAGMKYAVLTTRHTSGFLLWDSATSEFDVAASSNKTDVAGQFVKECREQGIAPGFYYCLWGGNAWMPHPNARAIILAQLCELASKYGEIPYFWIDMGNWRPANLSPQEIYDAIKNLQPNAVVILNQHIQDGRTMHYFPTDVVNGEVTLPPARGHQPFRMVNGKSYYLPFEFEPVSQRVRKGTTTAWGPVGAWFTYGAGKGFPASQPIPAKDLFGWIKQGYDRGAANVLLSLAADHTGSMRPDDVRQLEELGKMLREAGLLEVPKATAQPVVSLAQNKPAKASGVWENNDHQYGAAAAFDDDSSTRWGGPVGAKAGWLEVDLGKDTTISSVVIQEGWDRTREFAVQYKAGDQWKDAVTGTTIGADLELTFAPVTAQVFRLNIIKATDVPTIWEFQLFGPGHSPAHTETPLKAKPEAMAAWQDMRFGMFICWGPVTLTGREIGWSRGAPTPITEYDALYKKWNPQKFDAKAWVKVAKETGVKYIVFLTKHHDGFCLFDTQFTDYSIMNGPLKRDVTKELADACHEAGIGFFPYYSTCDWHHPDFPVTSPHGKVKRPVSNLDRYTEYLEAQTKELITKYGPLTGIWFDVPQCFDKARGERVIRHVRSLQPDILVNNRTGAPGDFDTPEQNVGAFNGTRPWESCITLGTQWTWKPNDKLKSYTEAVRMLAVCAVNNGNLALNTNPMPDGQIEPRQVESFKKIGEWLVKYGESIYGTRGGPFIAPDWKKRSFNTDLEHFSGPGGNWWGGSTHRGNVIYLHILRWPADVITLPVISNKIVKSSVLTGGEATVKQTDTGIEVTVPAAQRDATDTIVKLEFDGIINN